MLDMGHITRNQAAYDSFEPSDWGVYPGVTDNNEDQPSGGDELSNKLSKRAKMSGTESTAEKQNEEDMGRQTGDFDCYKIYFRSMGVMTLTMIVTLAVLHVVLSKMTCLFSILPHSLIIVQLMTQLTFPPSTSYFAKTMDRKRNRAPGLCFHGWLSRTRCWGCSNRIGLFCVRLIYSAIILHKSN